jgi:hypothetical protein
MSKLEVIFRLGLAHSLLIMDHTQRRPRSFFPETNNNAWVEAERGLRPEPATGEFDELWRMAESAKREVLPDWLSDPVTKLARLRNKLLHAGKKDLANEDIVGMILAVDEAIIWLFAPKGVPQSSTTASGH